ncbi:MAG: hypothetical protein SF029_19700 [bacterium]|nr:hypothetical protein [bacterium]
MMSTYQNLPEFLDRYSMWLEVYRVAEAMFSSVGDEDSLSTLKFVHNQVVKFKEQKSRIDHENLERLYKASRNPKFPHAVRTWMEDEWDDLWDSVS